MPLFWASLVALVVKNSPTNARDTGLIPESGRSLGVGNVKLLQYSCLENTMDRTAQWATGHGATKSEKQLSEHMAPVPRRVNLCGFTQVNPGKCWIVKGLLALSP